MLYYIQNFENPTTIKNIFYMYSKNEPLYQTILCILKLIIISRDIIILDVIKFYHYFEFLKFNHLT